VYVKSDKKGAGGIFLSSAGGEGLYGSFTFSDSKG
jgi:hypothetical protein